MPEPTHQNPTQSTATPRVLIVEDDASTRLLLETLVRRLWPRGKVESFSEVQGALEAWREQGADLALVDLGLPGIGGIAFLEQLAKTPSNKTVTVVVSHQSDRNVVVEAMKYRARDYIVKPFSARDLMQRLSAVLPDGTPSAESDAAPVSKPPTLSGLERMVREAVENRRLSLPIDRVLVEQLEAWNLDNQLSKTRILEHWALEPALVARVMGVANSGPYNRRGKEILYFSRALDQLDPNTVFNLATTLALQPGSQLQSRTLAAIAEEIVACQHALFHRISELSAGNKIDLSLCATACALHRVGELATLQVIQAWLDLGGALDAEGMIEILERFGPEADDAIKSQWLIPAQVKALCKAIDELPPGVVVDRTIYVMRIAGLHIELAAPETIENLKQRAGLTSPAASNRTDATAS